MEHPLMIRDDPPVRKVNRELPGLLRFPDFLMVTQPVSGYLLADAHLEFACPWVGASGVQY